MTKDKNMLQMTGIELTVSARQVLLLPEGLSHKSW